MEARIKLDDTNIIATALNNWNKGWNHKAYTCIYPNKLYRDQRVWKQVEDVYYTVKIISKHSSICSNCTYQLYNSWCDSS